MSMMEKDGDVTPNDLSFSRIDENCAGHCCFPNAHFQDNLAEKRFIMKAELCEPKESLAGQTCGPYGLLELYNHLKWADKHPGRRLVTFGMKPTKLMPEFYSTDNVLDTFNGTIQERSLGLHEIEADVPDEYRFSENFNKIQPLRLPLIKMTNLTEDTLFFLFYTCGGSVMQLTASRELHRREWLFHRREQVWLKLTDSKSDCNNHTFEFFDPLNWRQETKSCPLPYEQLEKHPPRLSFPTGL